MPLKNAAPKVATRTPNVPKHRRMVDAAKYAAMKQVVLAVIPKRTPGITQAEMMTAIGKRAPRTLFPRKTYMWWGKCVQLDLEARGLLAREATKPLRWHRT